MLTNQIAFLNKSILKCVGSVKAKSSLKFDKLLYSWQFWDWDFYQKVLSEGYFARYNATHVVTSTSNIITSLFDLA